MSSTVSSFLFLLFDMFLFVCLFCSASLFLSKLKCLRERKKKATRVFSPKKLHFCLKNFGPENKKRTKTTRHTKYSAMSSIPSGGPPGGTHTQELWYSLRGIDAELQSVSCKDKCPCDACCARVSTPIFVPLFSYFCPTKFF